MLKGRCTLSSHAEVRVPGQFMQVHWSGPDDFQALHLVKFISGIDIVYVISNLTIFKLYYWAVGPFGQCQSGESLYHTKDLSFLAPRDKRCLPAQSSSERITF